MRVEKLLDRRWTHYYEQARGAGLPDDRAQMFAMRQVQTRWMIEKAEDKR